jgi:coenzyme F420-0:L-glutamate ligase/coenzyme F420-1:gamma-L-glutamate ligase
MKDSEGDFFMATVQIIGLDNIPEVKPGDHIAKHILHSAGSDSVQQGDIVVITHKIVSKAEGQLVDIRTIEPSPLAMQWATVWQKDPRQVEVSLRESRRIVKMERGILICETRHGLICANAGVDASNVPGDNIVCLLPVDPDASANQIAVDLSNFLHFHVPVIITDSFGRPWRNGITNIAIGVAGMNALQDYRGQVDGEGREMHVSVLAIADEIAGAAELVMNKLDKCPVAIVRGYNWQIGEGSGKDLVMKPEMDLFR